MTKDINSHTGHIIRLWHLAAGGCTESSRELETASKPVLNGDPREPYDLARQNAAQQEIRRLALG